MSWAKAGGVAAGAVAGAAIGANTPNAMTIDQWALSMGYTQKTDEQEMAEWQKNLYSDGVANPWQTSDGSAPRTSPYKSAYDEGDGYYVDKNGHVISEDVYNQKTKQGRKKDFNRKDRYTWVTVEKTPEAAGTTSPMAMEESNYQFFGEMQPIIQENTRLATEQETGLIPLRGEAESSALQYAIDTNPEKALADVATYKYTQEAMPLKMGMVQDLSALARRNNETEAARMAGAEVAQQYNTMERTLGDDIRRTGAIAGSGRMAGLQADLDLNRTKDTAGARVAARQNARQTQFQNMTGAIGVI
jgi:hypothetical protein